MRSLEIGELTIGQGDRPAVIAEVGTNYRDDLDLAQALIDAASQADADVIKFQTHIAKKEMVQSSMEDIGFGDLFERISTYEMSETDHRMLKDKCEESDIEFLSTPFSVEAVDILESVDVPAYKIGSGELTNYELLDKVAATNKPLLISTGMADLNKIKQTVDFVRERTDEVALLYCVSSYPTPPSEFNLGAIERMKKEFDVPVGFSDHSMGTSASMIALAQGADFVEKHFTLDRRLPGGDQEVSIEPDQLNSLTDYATLVHETQGTNREVREEEADLAEWAHHSLVAKEPIAAGEAFTEENLTTKRPGTGIPADQYFKVMGKKATHNIKSDTILTTEDFV